MRELKLAKIKAPKITPNRKGERIVQTLGYIPMKQRIENYLDAGITLASIRAEQYDADNQTDPRQIQRKMFDKNIEKLEILYKSKELQSYIESKIERQKNAEKQEFQNAMQQEKKEVSETPKTSPKIDEKGA